MEHFGIKLENYDIIVKTLLENFFAVTGPDVLGHPHYYRAWFFHVKDHFFWQAVAYVRENLAVQGREQTEKGLDKRCQLFLESSIVAYKHDFFLKQHTAVQLDNVIHLDKFS